MRVRFIKIVLAALVGNITITLYLVISNMLLHSMHADVVLRRLLQWDASQALGQSAFSGGWPAALLGFAMDMAVSLAWAAVFSVLLSRVRAARHLWSLGAAFGVVVMLVMMYGVIPFGAGPPFKPDVPTFLNIMVAHTLFFGVPVAVTIGQPS